MVSFTSVTIMARPSLSTPSARFRSYNRGHSMEWTPDRHSRFLICIADTSAFAEFHSALNHELVSTHAVRLVRGSKMRSVSRLYDEFAAAFQFPEYFGENWDAFDDCLADLSWLPASGYVLLVSRAIEVLTEGPPSQFAIFVDILISVCREWEQRETPFHALLQCTKDEAMLLQAQIKSPLDVIRVEDIRDSGALPGDQDGA
jgi:hypothetical protein